LQPLAGVSLLRQTCWYPGAGIFDPARRVLYSVGSNGLTDGTQEAPMTATQLAPRRTTRKASTRAVKELLLELAYQLHTTKVLKPRRRTAGATARA